MDRYFVYEQSETDYLELADKRLADVISQRIKMANSVALADMES